MPMDTNVNKPEEPTDIRDKSGAVLETVSAQVEAKAAETPLTPEKIMELIAVAGAGGDIAEVVRLGNQLKKHQGDILKAEATKLKDEATAMAGDREKLAAALLKVVKTVANISSDLEALKATGFTFKLAYTDAQGVEVKPAVALSVPTIKAKSGGGGGGSTGALKDKTGLSRHELVDQYATDDEKIQIAEAENGATSRPDSARYTAEKPVIKRILADNPHLIKH